MRLCRRSFWLPAVQPPDQRASHDRIAGHAGQTGECRGYTANRAAVSVPQPASARLYPPVTHRLRATAVARNPVAPKNGLGIASLVLAVIGLLSVATVFAPIVLGVVAVVFGFVGAGTRQAWHRQQRRGRDRRHRAGRLGNRRRFGVHRDLDDGLEGRPRRRLHRLHAEGRLQPGLAAAVRRPVPAKRARPIERDVDSGTDPLDRYRLRRRGMSSSESST